MRIFLKNLYNLVTLQDSLDYKSTKNYPQDQLQRFIIKNEPAVSSLLLNWVESKSNAILSIFIVASNPDICNRPKRVAKLP